MTDRVIIIGAGMAGLAAAIDLVARGVPVTVLERAAAPGGKMHQIEKDGFHIDAGPTVFTMRWAFERLCEHASKNLDDYVTLKKAEVLARHAWPGSPTLDLFADHERSVDAIGEFAGRDAAHGFRSFTEDAGRIFRTLKESFITAPRPGPIELSRRIGFMNISDLLHMKPFTTMWRALGTHFKDPRLQQLFGRYATYCGSSPYQAPATLMLVAYVEAEGVWLVDGGMTGLAKGFARMAEDLGTEIRYGTGVSEIVVESGRAAAIITDKGERITARAVISNGDVAAFASGALGAGVRGAATAPLPAARSLSAVTWAMAAETEGFPLAHHTVFFSDDYEAEFDAIFKHRRLPASPTTYICANGRADDGTRIDGGPEPLMCLVNAPAIGDTHTFSETEIDPCKTAMLDLLKRCGLSIRASPATKVTTPSDFATMFPGSGGAIYGQASHGWMASFQRPGARTKIPGLYMAGGSVHPGPGVPMAALSGRQAAAALMADRSSKAR